MKNGASVLAEQENSMIILSRSKYRGAMIAYRFDSTTRTASIKDSQINIKKKKKKALL